MYIKLTSNGGNDRQCLKAKSLRNYLLQSFSCLPSIYLGLVTVTDRILGLRYGFLRLHSCPKKQTYPSCTPQPGIPAVPRATAVVPRGEVSHVGHSLLSKPRERGLWGSGRRTGCTFQQEHNLRLNGFEAVGLPSHHLSQYIGSRGLTTRPQMYLGHYQLMSPFPLLLPHLAGPSQTPHLLCAAVPTPASGDWGCFCQLGALPTPVCCIY